MSNVISSEILDVMGNVIEKSVQSNLLIYDLNNHWKQKSTIDM